MTFWEIDGPHCMYIYICSLFVMCFCNYNNEKNINLKIRKSSLISRLPNGIVQILNRYIQACKTLKKKFVIFWLRVCRWQIAVITNYLAENMYNEIVL